MGYTSAFHVERSEKMYRCDECNASAMDKSCQSEYLWYRQNLNSGS